LSIIGKQMRRLSSIDRLTNKMNVTFFCVMVAGFAVVHLLLYLLFRELDSEFAKLHELNKNRLDALREVLEKQNELIEKYRELRRNLRR